MKPSVPYHELLIEKLQDPKTARAYLEVAIEEFEADGDKEHFLSALRNVIEAQTDENIDYSDIPETDDTFWEKAEIVYPKSHWNYRIYRYSDEQGGGLGLHEAHYEHGKRISRTERPIIVGETIDELKATLRMMDRDIERFKDTILDHEQDG